MWPPGSPGINKHFTFYVKLLFLAKCAFVRNLVCPHFGNSITQGLPAYRAAATCPEGLKILPRLGDRAAQALLLHRRGQAGKPRAPCRASSDRTDQLEMEHFSKTELCLFEHLVLLDKKWQPVFIPFNYIVHNLFTMSKFDSCLLSTCSYLTLRWTFPGSCACNSVGKFNREWWWVQLVSSSNNTKYYLSL